MVRRLGLGKNIHLTYTSLALNTRYIVILARVEMKRLVLTSNLGYTFLSVEKKNMTFFHRLEAAGMLFKQTKINE